ncbi:MAG: 1-acyl-sn-glycerol-3-phosphate acyltransferase [Chitinophagales bacterium]|nr:1-acyl-sn-glycerol-3-phosphate acyltransferase [Chitinophagales bacterium]
MISWCFRLLLKANGWQYDADLTKQYNKCVVIVAPHTSFLDFIYGKAIFDTIGVPAKFAIKKELFFFPFSVLFKRLGGIAIDRTPKNGDTTRISLTEAMINMIQQQDKICLVITPEGSRSSKEQWRTGFYHIAKNAKVPLILGSLDFKTKKGYANTLFEFTDDFDADMRRIMEFYKDKIHLGRFPERGSLDKRFV